ncbi:MAG: hypothetical protein ACOZBL_03805 [Patescibacteria group bacterium]
MKQSVILNLRCTANLFYHHILALYLQTFVAYKPTWFTYRSEPYLSMQAHFYNIFSSYATQSFPSLHAAFSSQDNKNNFKDIYPVFIYQVPKSHYKLSPKNIYHESQGTKSYHVV